MPSFVSVTTDMSLGQRLIRVLHDPKSAFESLGDEPGWQDWLVPTVVVCLLAAVSTWVTLPLMDPERPEVRDELLKLTPDQRQQTIEWVQMVRDHGWLTLPMVNGFSALAAVAAVLLGVSRYVFKSDASLRHMLVVTAYGFVVQAIESLVRTPLMLLSGSLQVHLGPGALVTEEMAHTFLGKLLTSFSFFTLWQVWIIGIGLGVLAGVPVRRSLITVVMMWSLWLVFAAAALAVPMGVS